MKAIKKTLTVNVEVLSIDSIPALIQDMMNCFRGHGCEYLSGELVSDDGDLIKWNVSQENVDI